MNGFKKYAECKDNKRDCTAYCDGNCIALEDSDFGDKPCPFYMDHKTKRKTEAECKARLAEIGWKKKQAV